jgi:hypothetical protein
MITSRVKGILLRYSREHQVPLEEVLDAFLFYWGGVLEAMGETRATDRRWEKLSMEEFERLWRYEIVGMGDFVYKVPPSLKGTKEHRDWCIRMQGMGTRERYLYWCKLHPGYYSYFPTLSKSSRGELDEEEYLRRLRYCGEKEAKSLTEEYERVQDKKSKAIADSIAIERGEVQFPGYEDEEWDYPE